MLIRKISIGPDYKNAMNYTHGQEVLDKSYRIHLITQKDDGAVSIFIEKNTEIILWKSIGATTPFVLEYNIEF
jgi:hypothetical protein